MTIPRFPLPDGQPVYGEIILSGSSFRHLKKVLRVKPGEMVSFYDQEGYEYPSVVEHISRDEVRCINSQKIKKGKECSPRLTLIQGLLKRDKMDFLVEKACELGVYKIIPIITERSEIKIPEEKINSRIAHWGKIAEAAISQSRRSFIPIIEPPRLFKKAIELCPAKQTLFLSEERIEKDLKDTVKTLTPFKEISIIVGPPGGFSKAEVTSVKVKGFNLVGLKEAILRSETAAIAVLSVVQYELGNL